MLKRIAVVLALSAAHFVLSFGLLLLWLKMKVDLLDERYRPLTLLERTVETASEALAQPFVPLIGGFERSLPWVPFVLNSLAWGAGLYVVTALILWALGKRRSAGRIS